MLIAAALVLVLLAAGIYLAVFSGMQKPSYTGISLGTELAPAGKNPRYTAPCYIDVTAMPPPQQGLRVNEFAVGFQITNYGNVSTDFPASIFMVFNDELVLEEKLDQRYPPGSLLFGGKKTFLFGPRDFPGSSFSPVMIYNRQVELKYKLIYCAQGCIDPLRDGLVFYEGDTRVCQRTPFPLI